MNSRSRVVAQYAHVAGRHAPVPASHHGGGDLTPGQYAWRNCIPLWSRVPDSFQRNQRAVGRIQANADKVNLGLVSSSCQCTRSAWLKSAQVRMHILSYTRSTQSKVSNARQTCLSGDKSARLVVPIALLALVVGATLGGLWHHHANTPADTCPICHLSHQAIAPSPASIRVSIPAPRGFGPEPERHDFTIPARCHRTPPRPRSPRIVSPLVYVLPSARQSVYRPH